jgi:hypothetical protein
VLVSVALLFAACGGSGDGVSIGSGQNPDPVVVDFPIAYIKAPLPADDNGELRHPDIREQISFEFGADLYFRDRASPSAEGINITGEVSQGLAAIRDVEIDFDGSRLLFAMRVPFDPNLDEDELPTWNIWQYTFETAELKRVIASDLTAEIGHDIMPKYLPDGRIIFASTRQTQSQAILLDEGKGAFPALDENDNEYAFNLHVMDDDGNNVKQVTFNQSHDLDPAVLDNGQIVFSRWDNNGPNDAFNLYRMNPDGSNLELLYGQHSHETGTNGATIQFTQPRQAEDGRIMTVARPFTDSEGGGELLLIDTPQYVENTQPTRENIGVLNGPAQQDATINAVSTEPGTPSPGGRYYSAYPIQDGTERLMVSWTQCRLVETLPDDGNPDTDDQAIVPCTDDRLAALSSNGTPAVGEFAVAPPLYGIWIYDPRDDTQLPIVTGEEGFAFTEVVTADPRPTPPVVLDGLNDFPLDVSLAENGEALLNIRSVYDFDGVAVLDIPRLADPGQTLAADRPARFLRIEKAVSQPDDDLRDIDDTAFGVTTAFGMKEIVGYAMIEPDGSVMVKVPANTALMISVLDDEAKRLDFSPRHLNWISLAAGQVLACNGCHDPASGLSHGRFDAFDSAYAGAQTAGVSFYPAASPQWFVGEVGETMAEVRARVSCGADACSSIQPSMDVVYRDVWTADPLLAENNPDIDYLYADLATASPASLACQQDWQANCRSVINYESIIHPLWKQPRPVFDANDQPVIDPATGLQRDNNCLNCHTPVDPATGLARVPAGQLQLQDGPSAEEPDHFLAYRELLVTDNLQVLVGGQLVDATRVVGQDADGNDIVEFIPVDPPATAGSAAASSDFFDRFNDPQDLHFNSLSRAEQRLVAEWLDVGAQYYNNPFDAPAN